MSTRKQLEDDLKLIEDRIKNSRPDTPAELMNAWRQERKEISFELDNLYDDQVNEFTD